MRDHKIKLELVKSTGTNPGPLLFNNREKYEIPDRCNKINCSICINGLRPEENKVASKVTNIKYNIDRNLNCENCGIYRIICPCSSAYNGKTTTEFGKRFPGHFKTYRDSSVRDHTKTCRLGKRKEQFKIYFLENCHNRGKYTLSEREFLWNERLGGEINIQKILKSSWMVLLGEFLALLVVQIFAFSAVASWHPMLLTLKNIWRHIHPLRW